MSSEEKSETTEEIDDTEYLNKEAMKTVVVKGFAIGMTDTDPTLLTVQFMSIPRDLGPKIFSEVGMTLHTAKRFVESMHEMIENCEKALEALKTE